VAAAMRLNAMKNRTKWLTQEQMDRMPGLPNSYWGRIIYDEPLLHDSWLDVAKKYKILVWNKDTREYDYNRRERITEEEKEKVKKIWTTAISDFKKTDYKLLYDGVMRLAKEEPKLEDQIVSLKRLHDQQKRELIHRLPFTWKEAVEILLKVGAELALLGAGEAITETIKKIAASLGKLKIGETIIARTEKNLVKEIKAAKSGKGTIDITGCDPEMVQKAVREISRAYDTYISSGTLAFSKKKK
jgi:hypothetical protein